MIKLIRRNLLRNKRRTLLTMASLAMALFILSLLGVVNDAMDFADEAASPDRLVVRHAISLTFSLPESYEARLRSIEHVVEVSPQNWFQGVYKDQRPENFFPRFAIDPNTFRTVFYEYEWDEAEWETFASQRTAFASGRALAEDQGWAIGDTIAIQGRHLPDRRGTATPGHLRLRRRGAGGGRSSSTDATLRRRLNNPGRERHLLVASGRSGRDAGGVIAARRSDVRELGQPGAGRDRRSVRGLVRRDAGQLPVVLPR